tara:strand:- start:1541 stop:1792 length:252 start_codon:yes stop_codon:yes gene_type:complete
MEEQQQLNIDLTTTTGLEGPTGGKIFGQGVILRKVSKFVVAADEDAIMPIPVFYDLETNKILVDSLPKELREEYKDVTIVPQG